MNTFSQAWIETVRLLYHDHYSDSRAGKVTEILNHTMEIDMTHPFLKWKDRRLNHAFLFAEAYWILSGRNDVAFPASYVKAYATYSDDGMRLSGAYGPKIVEQVGYVVDTLIDSPVSRQAIISIWRENPRKSLDIPCTLTTQFLLRGNVLHQIVNMRSSDTWLGVPYDVFTFTMLAIQILIELFYATGKRYALGTMYHNAGSRHLYKRDAEKFSNFVSMNSYRDPEISMTEIYDQLLTAPQFIQSLLSASRGYADNLPQWMNIKRIIEQ